MPSQDLQDGFRFQVRRPPNPDSHPLKLLVPDVSTLVMESRHAELPVGTMSPRFPSIPIARGASRWTGGKPADDSCGGTKYVRHKRTESGTRLLVGNLVGNLSERTEKEYQQGDSHSQQMPFCRDMERRKRP